MLSPKENGSQLAAKEKYTKVDYYSSPLGRCTASPEMPASNPNQLLYSYHIQTHLTRRPASRPVPAYL